MAMLSEFFREECLPDGRWVLIGLDNGDIPNGSRVEKANSELGDAHQDGALGTVVGAVEANVPQAKWLYWVKFDDDPDIPVTIAGHRVRRVGGGTVSNLKGEEDLK